MTKEEKIQVALGTMHKYQIKEKNCHNSYSATGHIVIALNDYEAKEIFIDRMVVTHDFNTSPFNWHGYRQECIEKYIAVRYYVARG